MTSPVAVPTGGPLGTLSSQLAAELAGSTAKKPTATPDLYGLGTWSGQTVNPGDLPILAGILGSGKATTGNAIVQAFASGDPQSVATIQRALYLGGYYSGKYVPTYGVIKPQDVSAFGNAVTVAGQSKASVSDVLLSGAQYGTAAGVAAARAQGATAKVASVTLPNTQDLEAEAIKAFESELGHKPTPSEAAAFAASYRAMSAGVQRAGNQAMYDASAVNAGGLSAGQETDLEQQTADATQPYSAGSTEAAENDNPPPPVMGSANAAENDQNEGLLNAQNTSAADDFSSEMASLGSVADQVQTDATPPVAKPGAAKATGLTQVDQESVEDPTVAATNFADNADPKAADAHSLAGQFDAFLSILGSHFGGSS